MSARLAPHWVAPYVGLRFQDHGRGPDTFDCWGLVRHVLAARFDIADLPDHGAYSHVKHAAGVAAMFQEGLAQAWHRVEDGSADPGDIVVFERPVKGETDIEWHPHHVGLIVAPFLMLHIEAGTDSVVEHFDRQPWSHRIEGIYRHNSRLGEAHG